jgi:hypothetical protein
MNEAVLKNVAKVDTPQFVTIGGKEHFGVYNSEARKFEGIPVNPGDSLFHTYFEKVAMGTLDLTEHSVATDVVCRPMTDPQKRDFEFHQSIWNNAVDKALAHAAILCFRELLGKR